MRDVPTTDHETRRALKPRNRRARLSAMRLLAAGALCAATPASAIDITDASQLQFALNAATITGSDFDIQIRITGGDLDLGGVNFLSGGALQGLARVSTLDGVVRTVTNGSITVTSPSDAAYSLLVLDPTVAWDAGVVLNNFARLDIDGPDALGANGTVTAASSAEIRIFTASGSVTQDATFWNKISGVDDQTTVAFVANGEAVLTALPTFDAKITLDSYSDFTFNTSPLVDPTVTLGASLTGNHDVTINNGTLNLANFDFTIDSLAGAGAVTLGSGTLTTGDASDTTYAGVISGTGNLVKTGAGMFTLTGTNTYTGTTTVSDGTLVVNADLTGTSAVTVENGGTLDLNADLLDTVVMTVDMGGLLNLNDIDQTFATIAGGGTMNLGTAALTVGDATDTTFSGAINGSGSLTKVGAGNLTLSGMNTYAGATTISAGTLTLDGDLNNDATVTIATGATLDLNDDDETVNTIIGGGDIMLGTATLTVGNSANNTFGGTISESGGLTKQGSGTLTLSGAQTYTGATAINGGALLANGDLATSGVTVGNGASFILESTMTDATADVTVDAGGTIYGTGTIGDDLINNGTVMLIGPGASDTLTVNGDYTQGAAGTLQIQLGSAGGLVVTGTANVDGILDISGPADPANFDINGTYNAVTAGGIAGTFATVTDNFAFLDLSSNNVGGNIEITLARNAVALSDIARTTNQTTVANVLDGIGAPAGNLEDAIDRILASSENQARRTYDQLAGAGAATASTQIAASAVNQSHRVLDQVIGVGPGSTRPLGAFSQAPDNSSFDDIDHITLFSFDQGTAKESQGPKPQLAGLDPSPWATIYGGFGKQGDGAEGLDFTRYGLIAGLDLESAESTARYGLSLGVEQSGFDFNQDNGDVDIASIYLSGYTRQPFGNNYHFTVTGALGYHSHESSRNILIGVTPAQAQADFDSYSVSVAAELSKAFHITHTPIDPGGHPTITSIEPFARLDYSISSQDGYSETGAGTAGLNVGSNDFDSIRAAFGARVQHQYMFINQHEAVFQARGLVNVAVSNSDSDLNVSFVNTPGSGFAIEGSDQDDIFGQIGVGLTIEINDRWDMHFDLDQQFSDNATATVLAGGLRYNF